MVLWLRLRNVILSLSEILSRPMHPSPHCVQRLVHFREKQNVVLPKPIMCAEKHWWWVAACEFCTNARSFDIVRLTSQSGGFPGSLQRGGGGGHDVRRCRHRAARGDAHALHKQVVVNYFTIFGSHSMMTDLKSYQIFLLPASSWQACPVRGWGSAPPPPSCSTSHLKCNSTSARKYKSCVPTNPLLQLSQIHFHRFSQSQRIVSHAPTPAGVVCAKNFVHVKVKKGPQQ